ESPRGLASCRRPVALLVFLSAAARTWIVAPDLRLLTAHGLDARIVAADARRRLRARGPGRRHRVRRRSRCPEHRRRGCFGARIVQDQRRAPRRRPSWRRHVALAENRPQPPEVAHDLLVHALLHRLEEREAFLLVLDERIALAVPAQPYALF